MLAGDAFFSFVRVPDPRRHRDYNEWHQLSAAALPLLPGRGVHITVTRPWEPHGESAEAAYRRHDRVGVPALLELDGVAGVYAFASAGTTLDRDWSEAEGTTTFHAGQGERGQIRVRLCFLDGDPQALGPAPAPPLPPEVEAAEEVLFEGPLETIVPRRWDWFDAEPREEAAGAIPA